MRWPMVRRVERQARRMHDMMRRLDVDAAALARLRQGDAYAEARSRCLSCGTSDKCLRWLDEPPRSDRRPDFCPNVSLFDACKRRP
jgi:Family of unknown function (DUF6455)